MSELNIYQRINAVMKDVQYVQKDKAVSGGGLNYKAVTHDQVVSVVRASLVNHGIVIEPKQTDGLFITKRDVNAQPTPVKMALYGGRYDIYFVNIDKPSEKACVTVEAHANDNGDKAPGKAITYAVKTAVLKMFFLETGENDESRAEDPALASRRKNITRSDLARYIQDCGYTSDQVAKQFGVEFAQLNVKEAFDCVTYWKSQQ